MEEDHDELRFVCKLCDKRYPSGKSLGGHMRSHVIAASAAANSAESDEKFEPMRKLSTLINNGAPIDNGNGIGNSSSYGLRENPKKTWRAVDSSTISHFPNEKICKQCGRGFQSLKALCGHMACHSDKDKGLKDYDHSWTSENLDQDDKLVIDSHSDTEEGELQDPDPNPNPTPITRSKSKKYKKIVVKSSFSLTNTSNNSNYNYGSSSVSEVDEHEQEEVALCLMMLSKDSSNWGGVNSVVESSDNNYVNLETKSSSIDMKIGKKELEMNSNSGGCRNGIKKVESDISVEELLLKKSDNKKMAKGFDFRELTYEEKLEIRRNLFREFGYSDDLKKRIRDEDVDDSYNPAGEGMESYKKRDRYQCMNCSKIFTSFQGLGGHRPCHKKSKYENGENSFEGEFNRNPKAKYVKKTRPKKIKGHECPICFRMFKSGQALGGHKRSHFINGAEERIDHLAAIEDEGPAYHDMIDLNLPAPEEE